MELESRLSATFIGSSNNSETISNPIMHVHAHSQDLTSCERLSALVTTPCADTLLSELRLEPRVNTFLQLTGFIWSDNSVHPVMRIIQWTWCVTVRVFILTIMCSTSYFFFNPLGSSLTLQTKCLDAAFGITLFFQIIVLVPSIFTLHTQLNARCPQIDVKHYEQSLKLCYITLAISVISGLSFPVFVLLFFSPDQFDAFIIFLDSSVMLGEMSISCLLAVNMLFISAEARTCCSLVDELVKLQHDREITLESLSLVRGEITRRVTQQYYKTNLIIFVALLDVLIVVVVLLFLTEQYADDVHTGLYLGALLTLFVKEIPFLIFVFLQGATVNDRADALVKLIGVSKWEASQESARMSLYINADADKISFPLANMRLTRSDVVFRFAVWSLTLLVGILKVAVGV